MSSPTLHLALLCLAPALAQHAPLPESCGVDRAGRPRGQGDSWSPDGCNNCRCLAGGGAGCTRQLCPTQGAACSEGNTWQERSGAQLTSCRCTQGRVLCGSPGGRSGVVHCTDSTGTRREVGEGWQEDCNSCRCSASGVAGCTKKQCGVGLGLQCRDRLGELRQPGEVWTLQRAGRANLCQCTEGLVLCIPEPESRPKLQGAGVNFPG